MNLYSYLFEAFLKTHEYKSLYSWTIHDIITSFYPIQPGKCSYIPVKLTVFFQRNHTQERAVFFPSYWEPHYETLWKCLGDVIQIEFRGLLLHIAAKKDTYPTEGGATLDI